MAHFEIYEDESREFQWRLRASNGEIVASGEGYSDRWTAERGVRDVVDAVREAAAAPGAAIDVRLGERD